MMEEFLKQQRKLGNPAFPCVHKFAETDIYFSGMSLRDWFAGQALHGLDYHANPKTVAKFCYECADAMLKERENGD